MTYILEKRWRKENWKIRKYCSEFRFLFFGIGMKSELFQSHGQERIFNYHTTALISHASKVMLKILQGRLQQYMNYELPDVQAGFRKGRRTKDQIANIHWIIEKAREFQKNIFFCFLDYTKAFDCGNHNKQWVILKEMGIPDHLTCLLRNLYQLKKQQLELDMEQQTGSKLGKEFVKAVYCQPAYLIYMQVHHEKC